jgi:Proto-chlorophyllide reductase 57 kD subunit
MMNRAHMNWNDAAEDLLHQILAQTPYPVRDQTESQLRGIAEAISGDEGKNRVGVETVIAAWVRNTPEALRADLPRLMDRFGLDPDEYRHLLE